jgi:hypothetical protein
VVQRVAEDTTEEDGEGEEVTASVWRTKDFGYGLVVVFCAFG